jgi:signal transduction histidine kinase
VGGLLALFDNVFYSTALALAAVTSANGFDVGFAAVHGLMVVGFITQLYSLTLPLGLGIAAPPVVLLLLFRPAPAVNVIVVCSCLMALLLMYQTRKRREVARRARRLEAELKQSLAQLRVGQDLERYGVTQQRERIVFEPVRNAVRYAGPSKVEVCIETGRACACVLSGMVAVLRMRPSPRAEVG